LTRVLFIVDEHAVRCFDEYRHGIPKTRQWWRCHGGKNGGWRR
jgi:hypothetical protein